jgi:putative acetyltransferase
VTIELRPYRSEDGAPTRRVFERAVRETASRDYSPEQVEAWAPTDIGDAERLAWSSARADAETIVAVEGHELLGFGDLVGGRLFDMLYVDPSAGGLGVGTALIEAILDLARKRGTSTVDTDASLTARPLFERHGFVVIEQQTPVVKGVAMTNFRMRRTLA